MPLAALEIPPGLFTEDPDYTTGPRWVNSDKIRFRFGKAQTIGGWDKWTSQTFTGVARDILGWKSLINAAYLEMGTHLKLWATRGGQMWDITPLDDKFTPNPGTLANDPIDTVSASDVVTVNHVDHTRSAGDFVIFDGAATFNNITLDGEFTVVESTSDDTYTVTATTVADATGSGGGAAVGYTYLLPVGLEFSIDGFGWGAGKWGEETWGTPRSSTQVRTLLRTWTIDNWGEDTLANPRARGIYTWDISAAEVQIDLSLNPQRATHITAAPDCNFMLVTGGDRHVAAFGCETVTGDGVIDPLLIRWSDQENFNDWGPVPTNTAGDQRLITGNRIIGAYRSRGAVMVITDQAAHLMQFIGPPFTFGFQQVGDNCGVVGPHAAIDYNGVLFWMGDRDFHLFDGTLRDIPCPVRNFIFDDINATQYDQIYAALNREYNEIMWLYASKDSTETDRYVLFEIDEGTWAVGTISRSTWLGRDQAYITTNEPIATGYDQLLYIHEFGITADGQPINAFIESGEFEIPEAGNEFAFVDRIIPDLENTGLVNFTIKTRHYPNAAEITKGPFEFLPGTEKIDFRARGRQFAVRFESNDLGTEWRLGKMRVRVQPDGTR